MTADKKKLRRSMLRRRLEQPLDMSKQYSQKINQHLLQWSDCSKAYTIAGYTPFKGEPDILFALQSFHQQGKRIVLPRVDEHNRMAFFSWPSAHLNELRPGKFGILEPQGQKVALGDIDLFFIPGLAFDDRGTRLGYGQGYYDRQLGRHRGQLEDKTKYGIEYVGIAYTWQLCDIPLPQASHDISMDALILPEEIKILKKEG